LAVLELPTLGASSCRAARRSSDHGRSHINAAGHGWPFWNCRPSAHPAAVPLGEAAITDDRTL